MFAGSVGDCDPISLRHVKIHHNQIDVIQVFDPPSKQARGEHAHIQAHKESPGTAVGRNQTSATNRARSLPVGRVRHSDRLVLRRIRKQASFHAEKAGSSQRAAEKASMTLRAVFDRAPGKRHTKSR